MQTTIQIITDIKLFNIQYWNKNVSLKIDENHQHLGFFFIQKLECIEFQKYYSFQSKYKREPYNLFNTSVQLLDLNIGIVTKTIAKIQWCRVSMTSYKIYISTLKSYKMFDWQSTNSQYIIIKHFLFPFGTLQTEIYIHLNEYSWWLLHLIID